ncbi:MAG: hypothetical protein EBU29_03810 [Gammaproteobacteria bacterium]|nr:hypothetical protein [Gammaproteobacteria bacterium]
MSGARPRVKLLAPTGQGRAEVIIRCPRRLERMLSQEFGELQLPPVQLFQGGVQGLWTFEEAELACFASRIASRVLWPLARFPALNADGLYAGAASLPWGQWLLGPRSLGLGFDGVHDQLRHTRFSALRIKDAIFDRLRQEGLPLPELDPAGAELQLHGVLHREQVTLYVVLGGGALHRRGWRRDAGVAPIKENLAAAILRLGGWGLGAGGPLFDPVCGSGTLLVGAGTTAGWALSGPNGRRFGREAVPRNGRRPCASSAETRIRSSWPEPRFTSRRRGCSITPCWSSTSLRAGWKIARAPSPPPSSS